MNHKQMFSVPDVTTLIANGVTLARAPVEVQNVVENSYRMIREHPEILDELLHSSLQRVIDSTNEQLTHNHVVLAAILTTVLTYHPVELRDGDLHITTPPSGETDVQKN